jgi:hypothetical protein
MGLGGLGRDHDIGPVASGAQGDGQADAARGAGDEEGLAGKTGHASALDAVLARMTPAATKPRAKHQPARRWARP